METAKTPDAATTERLLLIDDRARHIFAVVLAFAEERIKALDGEAFFSRDGFSTDAAAHIVACEAAGAYRAAAVLAEWCDIDAAVARDAGAYSTAQAVLDHAPSTDAADEQLLVDLYGELHAFFPSACHAVEQRGDGPFDIDAVFEAAKSHAATGEENAGGAK